MIEVWRRPLFVAGGAPSVFHLFCFGPAALRDDVPMSAARFGLPSADAVKLTQVELLPRAADPAWFDAFRAGALRSIAKAALGDLSHLDAAQSVTVILTQRPDAADLEHVQATWALAQWTVARGATVLLDAQANRYWSAAEVASWAPDRPFALSSEVNVIVEGEEGGAIATAVHTRGLQKFGRPDLVVRDVPAARWDAVAAVVRGFALQLVHGARINPGDTRPVEGGVAKFGKYVGDPLHLNNDALVITGSDA